MTGVSHDRMIADLRCRAPPASVGVPWCANPVMLGLLVLIPCGKPQYDGVCNRRSVGAGWGWLAAGGAGVRRDLKRRGINGFKATRGDVLQLADQVVRPARVRCSLEEPVRPVVRNDHSVVLHRPQNHARPRRGSPTRRTRAFNRNRAPSAAPRPSRSIPPGGEQAIGRSSATHRP